MRRLPVGGHTFLEGLRGAVMSMITLAPAR
jgi:hypothetical protein